MGDKRADPTIQIALFSRLLRKEGYFYFHSGLRKLRFQKEEFDDDEETDLFERF